LNYETVKNNIHRFIEIRTKHNVGLPKVVVLMVENDTNKNTRKQFLDEWKDADEAKIAKEENWSGEKRSTDVAPNMRVCPKIERQMEILVDGTVVLCCFDFEGKVIVGDVRKNKIEDIWTGSRLEEVRGCIWDKNYEELRLCKSCSLISLPLRKKCSRKLSSFLLEHSPFMHRVMQGFYSRCFRK